MKQLLKIPYKIIRKFLTLLGYDLSLTKQEKVAITPIITSQYPDYVQHWINLGLQIGEYKYISGDCFMDHNYTFLISLGDNVTISSKVSIFTHDGSIVQLSDKLNSKEHQVCVRLGCVRIEDNCFIGSGSIILPNTTIGANSIVGAGSVVLGNFPDNVVLVGNPARVISTLDEFIQRHNKNLETRPLIPMKIYHNVHNPDITEEDKEQIRNLLKEGVGYGYLQ